MDLALEDFLMDGISANDTDADASMMSEDINADGLDGLDDFTDKDEFFHSPDEYGISEYYGCKKMLYKTIGDSGVKVTNLIKIYNIQASWYCPLKRYSIAIRKCNNN